MNKKMLTSIVTLGMIATCVANAAITKEQCNRSDKTVWVENVANSDGSRGACVPKNTCKSKTFKSNFCVTDFKDIQLESLDETHKIINIYVKTQLEWTAGCTQFLDFDVNNTVGQDYIGCLSNGRYKTFEFDDTNEHYASTYVYDFRQALCMASGGNYVSSGNCDNISQNTCLAINGNYDSTTPTCVINTIKQDLLDRAATIESGMDAQLNYQLGINRF